MAQLLDQYGNPIQREVLTENQSARIGWVTREFADHPARGLTPQKLAKILEDAERGDLAAQADLFCDMEEKDAHIFAEMSKRKRAVLTIDWRVDPPRNASAAEKKLAEEVHDWLQDITDLEDVLLDCLDAIGHGFAALEIGWQRLGSTWHPGSLTHQPQRWFQTPQFDGNALRLRDGSMDGAELWPFGWVVHKHKAKSGYLNRAGLHRVLAWPYLFKNYSVRDLVEFLEIYGLPLRLGKYPSSATEREKATLLQAVASMGHSAAGIIPENMLIEFVEAAKGTGEPFTTLTNWCEKSQSKAILGGTLTSQADGKTSTNALGNVHNEVRHDLLISDARQLASTLTRDLVYPMLALNKGNIDPRRLPQFVFDTRCPEDMASYAEHLPKLVDMGMKIPREWAHDKLAIPAAQDGDEILLPAGQSPSPTPAKPAALRYQAALSAQPGAGQSDPASIIERRLNALAQPAINDWLNAIAGLVEAAPDLPALQEQLLSLFGDLPVEQLAAVMGTAMQVAELAGMAAVQDEQP